MGVCSRGGFVEGDAEVDVDVPAADLDVVDEESGEPLALGEVELVDGDGDAGCEVVDPATEAVVGAEFVALGDEGVAFCGHPSLAVGEFLAPTLGFGQVEDAGLVEVGQPAPFGFGGVEAALKPVELGGEELVVGSGGAGEDGLFSGEEQFGGGERGSELVEDELVEGVGADVAFAAAAFGAALDRVAVEACVVADAGAVGAASTSVDCSAGAAGADHETA